MKKKLSILCVLAFVATAANAILVDWYSIDDLAWAEPGHDLGTLTGKAAPATAWVAIYKATEARSSATSWYTDIIINADKTAGQGGVGDGTGDVLVHLDNCEKSGFTFFYEQVDLEVGASYYTVLWDLGSAHTPGINDEYIVLDKQTYQTPGDFEVFEKSKSSGIAWQTIEYATVPEPATLGLLGIAGMGIFLARRAARR